MRERDKRDLVINVHLPEGSTVNIVGGTAGGTSEGDAAIMAKIDDVQAAFDDLDTAVRDFMANGAPNVEALQAELDALRADDAVEDSKLDGLENGITNLKQAVDNLRPHADQTLPGDLPA